MDRASFKGVGKVFGLWGQRGLCGEAVRISQWGEGFSSSRRCTGCCSLGEEGLAWRWRRPGDDGLERRVLQVEDALSSIQESLSVLLSGQRHQGAVREPALKRNDGAAKPRITCEGLDKSVVEAALQAGVEEFHLTEMSNIVRGHPRRMGHSSTEWLQEEGRAFRVRRCNRGGGGGGHSRVRGRSVRRWRRRQSHREADESLLSPCGRKEATFGRNREPAGPVAAWSIVRRFWIGVGSQKTPRLSVPSEDVFRRIRHAFTRP